jgi:hypothetical protein
VINACRSVWEPDTLDDPGAASDPPDDPPGTMPVQPTAICSQEDRSFDALTDGQVYRPRGPRRERDRHHLAAFTRDHQSPMPALNTKIFDAGAGRFGHPQPIERQQRDKRMLSGRPEPGRDEQRTELVAVQPGGVGLILQARPADVRGG